MKTLFLYTLFFISANWFAKIPAINEVRVLFKQAVNDKNACTKLIGLLKPYNETDQPLLAGYKACATMVMAKYTINPFSRFNYFKTGKKLLEGSIAADPKNIELRFMRYSVQTNAPSFLNYTQNVADDKLFLQRNVVTLTDLSLKNTILSYLKKTRK